MNRRRFLGFLGLGAAAVAAEQAIPFNRVWSFPKTIVPAGSLVLPPGASIRFLRVYDPWEHRMLARFDMAYGFGALPISLRHTEDGWVTTNCCDEPRVVPIPASVPRELLAAVRQEADHRAHLRGQQIFGAYMPMPEKFMMLYS